MSAAGLSAAEESQVLLQDGVRIGRPVMIPGAFEPRAGSPRVSAATPDALPFVPDAPRAVPPRSLFERIWRYVMRPTDTPAF